MIVLENTYRKLDKRMYKDIEPTLKEGKTVLFNSDLCHQLKLNESFLRSEKGSKFLKGSTSIYGPLYAQAYAGHQYGHFTVLGDGRAVVLGEVRVEKELYDLQLKGSGSTPYSRNGDGLATLYSVLREYLVSEAMYSLYVPTTRSLAVIDTNENIRRMNIEKGGILVRSASSHIRIGTIQYAKTYLNETKFKEFIDYVINRHYPFIKDENKYLSFFEQVVKKQAMLIAKWQSIGFVHGVMNTDNMTISGETIDYGPCAFLDDYIPKKSFSSIDQNGRYSYINQPYIGSWNLARLAETLLELFSKDKKESIDMANEVLKNYGIYFNQHYYEIMSKKIGFNMNDERTKKLVDELLHIFENYSLDFTNTFRLLTENKIDDIPYIKEERWINWIKEWRILQNNGNTTERSNLMKSVNPRIIPRNMLVEDALISASKDNDYEKFNRLYEVLKDPYNYDVELEEKYLNPPITKEDYQTFCGT